MTKQLSQISKITSFFVLVLASHIYKKGFVNFIPCSPGEADTEHFQNSWASVWVKMATVWTCFFIYVWTLVAPLVLGRCREFDYADD